MGYRSIWTNAYYALNRVSDYLSRMEYNKEYTIKEITGKDISEVTCFAITRSKQIEIDNKEQRPKIAREFYIEERNNICTRRNVYDHIIFIFTEENCEMQKKLEKIMKRLIISTHDKWTTVDNNKMGQILFKNIFPLGEIQKTESVLKSVLQICRDKSYENIAINVDLKQRNCYENFKQIIRNVFKESAVNITLHLDQIINVEDAMQIEEILVLYHSINHCGFERM